MTNGELKEYVSAFPDDAPVSILCANREKRKLYKLEDVAWVTDAGQPFCIIALGEEVDMDAEIAAAFGKCEQDAEKPEGQVPLQNVPEVNA